MILWIRISYLTLGFFCFVNLKLYSQVKIDNNDQNEEYSTIILFRTFDIFSFDRSYKLYASDSLLGRIKTKDVVIIDTYDKGISLHATTKAPSLNADKRTNYQKQKKIGYPITLRPGQVYFVKCGYLTQNLFDLPRQPTIKLLKPAEVRKYLKRRFLRRKIKGYLYEEWLNTKDIKRLALKK
jgi:hypothetical protein